MNESPDLIGTIKSFPINSVDGCTVFTCNAAYFHDSFQVQTNYLSVTEPPGALIVILKTAGLSMVAVIVGVRALAVHGHRLVEIQRESAEHRGESAGAAGKAILLGYSRQRLARYVGQCRCDARLASHCG